MNSDVPALCQRYTKKRNALEVLHGDIFALYRSMEVDRKGDAVRWVLATFAVCELPFAGMDFEVPAGGGWLHATHPAIHQQAELFFRLPGPTRALTKRVLKELGWTWSSPDRAWACPAEREEWPWAAELLLRALDAEATHARRRGSPPSKVPCKSALASSLAYADDVPHG